MQDDPNRKAERRQASAVAIDGAAAVELSIRRAFLVHMDEQQRQYPIAAQRGSSDPGEARRR